MQSAEVRSRLVDALRLDLIGPSDTLGDPKEVLSQSPSRWYLSGFLVPLGADPTQRTAEDSADDLDQAGESGGGLDDDEQPERPAARQRYMPSSIGVSLLVPASAQRIAVRASWGDYRLRSETPEEWERTPREESLSLELSKAGEEPREMDLPGTKGLKIAILSRPVGMLAAEANVPVGAKTVSVFLVNRRSPQPDAKKDEAFAFQVHLELKGDVEFLSRPDLRSLASDEWDERVFDLQYRDLGEYAVGHNVATEAILDDGACCRSVRTAWIPEAEVERVAPANIEGIELEMDKLSQLKDGSDAKEKLGAFAVQYREWIAAQRKTIAGLPVKRKATAEELLNRAEYAAKRIENGIEVLADPQCLEAFSIANKCMAAAARRRLAVMQDKPPESITPAWRPFQLAFLLVNLKAIAHPEHDDRRIVDLLFFPTGGGKTEAYLGLAAFTLLLRRLRNPGIASAGLTVLMRYTLRLLTLDQLSRAATLICALELERQKDVVKFGEWPFEIGLWVGRAATPNRMGKKGDKDQETARARTIRFANDDRKPSPIPLEECPWCGTKFKPLSFKLVPNSDAPSDLRISCVNRECQFARGTALPILAVDEPIYRRLPCFLIATVDKFAALPWTGQVRTLPVRDAGKRA